jgi:uncharacterized protein YggE
MKAFRIASLAAGLLAALPSTAQDRDQGRQIVVTGQGQVVTVPDIAHVRIGVTTEAGTAAESLASNSNAMRAVMDRLAAEGIEMADMQTSNLALGPRFADGNTPEPQVSGYVARNLLAVRVDELDRLGAILDAVAGEGANTFEGLAFGLTDMAPASDEALRLAVADARRRAEVIAAGADVTLGEVTELSTLGGAPRPMDMANARMASESVPVAAGELSVTASVTAVFAIDD